MRDRCSTLRELGPGSGCNSAFVRKELLDRCSSRATSDDFGGSARRLRRRTHSASVPLRTSSLIGIVVVGLISAFLPAPMAFDVAIAYILMTHGTPLPYVEVILCTPASSACIHFRCWGRRFPGRLPGPHTVPSYAWVSPPVLSPAVWDEVLPSPGFLVPAPRSRARSNGALPFPLASEALGSRAHPCRRK